MHPEHDKSFAHLESAVAQDVRLARDDAYAAVLMIAGEVARDIRKSGARGAAKLSVISALADGAARGTADVGADIGCVAEGFMIGAMSGAEETPERTLTVIAHAADSFVKHVHESRLDAAAAARGLVEGAAAWAGKCALDPEAAANAAAQGAADSAADVDAHVALKVRAALTSAPIAGIPVALKELSGMKDRP